MNYLLVHISKPCSFTVLFNMSLFVVSLQRWRVRKYFKSAEASVKCTDHTPESMLPVVLKRLQIREALILVTLSRVCICQTLGLPVGKQIVSIQRYSLLCYLHKEAQVSLHKYRELATFWSKVIRFGGLKLQMAVRFHDDHDDPDGPEFSHTGPDLLLFCNCDLVDLKPCKCLLARSH